MHARYPCSPIGAVRFFENNPEGIRSVIRFIKPFKPTRLLIEAAGRLELALFCAAHKAGRPVCVCNPVQVRKFAQATVRMAKTDQLDAEDLAHFGEALKPELIDLKPERLRL